MKLSTLLNKQIKINVNDREYNGLVIDTNNLKNVIIIETQEDVYTIKMIDITNIEIEEIKIKLNYRVSIKHPYKSMSRSYCKTFDDIESAKAFINKIGETKEILNASIHQELNNLIIPRSTIVLK